MEENYDMQLFPVLPYGSTWKMQCMVVRAVNRTYRKGVRHAWSGDEGQRFCGR